MTSLPRYENWKLRKARLNDLYLDEAISRADHGDQAAAIKDQLDRLHEEMAAGAEYPILATLPTDPDELDATWKNSGLDWKRLVTKGTIKRIIVERGRRPRIADRLVYELR